MRAFPALAVAALLTACASTNDAPDGGTTPVVATVATAESQEVGRLFLLHDSGGSAQRAGPFLAEVTRPGVLMIEDRIAALTEVSAAEAAAGYTTEVPVGTTLRSASIHAGVATLDLSNEFASGGGSFSMSARLAQLVFTATSGPEWVRSVMLEIDGQTVSTFSSEGLTLTQPLTRTMSTDLLPQILVERPAAYEEVPVMLSISGLAAVTDMTFRAELLDADRALVSELPAITASGEGWGGFWVTVSIPEFPAGTELILHVWDDSVDDSTPTGERFIPVTAGG